MTDSKLLKGMAGSIDYLTITTKTDEQTKVLLTRLAELLPTEVVSRETMQPFRFKGFHGHALKHMKWGVRGSECIVMLSGGSASRMWGEIAPLRGRATRVDLAVTCVLSEPLLNLAKDAYEAELAPGGVKRTLYQSMSGGQTCYVGARSSQFFGRMYDKSAQQGLEEGRIWRYEVEIKKPAAEAVVSYLLETELPYQWVAWYVYHWFASRGVEPIFTATDAESAIEIKADVTTPERQLNWIRTQVRPTVQKLIIGGFDREVREALNLPEYKYPFKVD